MEGEQLQGDQDEDETVEEKIDRLGKEIQVLEEQARWILRSLPPITRPPVPAPLQKLRHAIKEKETERELLLEDQRVSKVVEEYLQENPSILEKADECPICLEPIFDVGGATDFLCCGKKTCEGCCEPLMSTTSGTCPLCRQRFPETDGESLSILSSKAAAGIAWAQCSLGTHYTLGSLGLAMDKEKGESLHRSAAAQGHSHAQFILGTIERNRNNMAEACRLFEVAASQGHMSALANLGVCYHAGFGVEQDLVKAVRLVTVSAKLQSTNLSAKQVLGYCFARKEGGLERSTVRSVHYMKTVVEEPEVPPDSMILYAVTLLEISGTYYPGEIAPAGHNHLPEALFWYRRAHAKSMDAPTVPYIERCESSIRELCAFCFKSLSTDNRKRCVECKAVYYCSWECGAADWKAGHKKDCTKALKKRLRATGEFSDI